ncbi:hypothetical protein [Aquella oligotrophica]|uniref:Peptidase A2 domain-containing protein n=1 Tax=Aquella oligotrophica TaxID=2067065 RepID=A0A2I7N5Z2_9NEIS|nr:hypothetical protein [Aquella oligotrophica]AUR51868.1 hypothetical protein CUN60_06015 [Aquella oligotrophica]
MLDKRLLLILSICQGLVVACSSGTGGSNSVLNQDVVFVPTLNYEPGNKTAVQASIGGGPEIIAEIDTGSELTVINESYVGNNIQKTSQIIPVTYGAGTNQVSGYLAYGTIQFTTTSGTVLSTSANAPIVVVTEGSVNQGGGNNAVLGMRMDNQVSSRLFLPYPYNQMMVLNRSESYVTFGLLNNTQLGKFATISQKQIPCYNYNVPATESNICWGTSESSVTYTYSESSGFGSSNYSTVFDSGEAIGNFYLESVPYWMVLTGNGIITNQLTATINTSSGVLPLPLTQPMKYTQPVRSGNVVNPGNQLFNTYQVLFDQVSGIMGFAPYTESW